MGRAITFASADGKRHAKVERITEHGGYRKVPMVNPHSGHIIYERFSGRAGQIGNH